VADPGPVVAATPVLDRAALVAVDGFDGSGKTTYASVLAAAYVSSGRPARVVHLDDFLHAPQVRHRLGRDSPTGFFEDSYDLARFRREVLGPVRAERARGAVVIVEGLFLHRGELWGEWDLSVFLDVPFEVSVARLAARDGSDPDPRHPSMRRYVEGQRIYLRTCRPHDRASIVLPNA
jgi:uridine kinase